MTLSLYEDVAAPPGEARLKVYRIGPPLSLSEVLPILSTTGVEVVDERPYQLEGLERESYIYDFGLRYHRAMPDRARELFQDTVAAVWNGYNESDGFNALVLAAGLTWRQATLLRAYAKYMRQGGTPFAQDYIEDALRNNVDITRYLVQLFEARFDPGRKRGRNGAIPADGEARQAKCADLEERIMRALDDVASLDHDRILRSYLTNIRATLRTNFFQTDDDGDPLQRLVAEGGPVGDPRPARAAAEVRDLRLLAARRGRAPALRLGRARRPALVRPPRRLPHRDPRPGQGADGEEHRDRAGRREGRLLRQAAARPQRPRGLDGRGRRLLHDVHLRAARHHRQPRRTPDGRQVVPPRSVVRHDGDDPYLVVAADKGTATFSDIANGISQDYGFWLGDAFASGGSVGYDHKAMGITARGAWVSVRRHFREMGVDCQNEDFTCVGIGDMSGDVFGNGMLCSEHIRLVAAFDHRDIFIDPNPDAATSYAERKRLFDLPRSSWQDYDNALISEGGGVFPRSAKSIPITPQMREALGLEAPANGG